MNGLVGENLHTAGIYVHRLGFGTLPEGEGFRQYTNCPYPVDSLPSADSPFLPPPLFEGQLMRRNLFDKWGKLKAIQIIFSVRSGIGLLVWICLDIEATDQEYWGKIVPIPA